MQLGFLSMYYGSMSLFVSNQFFLRKSYALKAVRSECATWFLVHTCTIQCFKLLSNWDNQRSITTSQASLSNVNEIIQKTTARRVSSKLYWRKIFWKPNSGFCFLFSIFYNLLEFKNSIHKEMPSNRGAMIWTTY